MSIPENYIKKSINWVKPEDIFSKFLSDDYQEKTMGIYGHNKEELILPGEVSKNIISRIMNESKICNLCKSVTLTTGLSYLVLSDPNKYECKWVEDGDPIEEEATSNLKIIEIKTHEVCVVPTISNSFIEIQKKTKSFDMASLVINQITRSMSNYISRAIFFGDGEKKPFGILYRAMKEANPSIGKKIKVIDLQKQNILENIMDMFFQLDPQYNSSHKDSSVAWFMPSQVFSLISSAMMYRKKNNSFFSFQEKNMFIMGVPVYIDNLLTQKGSSAVVLANLSEAYQYVIRQEIDTLEDPYSRKGVTKFYTRMKVGGDVVDHKAVVVGKLDGFDSSDFWHEEGGSSSRIEAEEREKKE